MLVGKKIWPRVAGDTKYESCWSLGWSLLNRSGVFGKRDFEFWRDDGGGKGGARHPGRRFPVPRRWRRPVESADDPGRPNFLGRPFGWGPHRNEFKFFNENTYFPISRKNPNPMEKQCAFSKKNIFHLYYLRFCWNFWRSCVDKFRRMNDPERDFV